MNGHRLCHSRVKLLGVSPPPTHSLFFFWCHLQDGSGGRTMGARGHGRAGAPRKTRRHLHEKAAKKTCPGSSRPPSLRPAGHKPGRHALGPASSLRPARHEPFQRGDGGGGRGPAPAPAQLQRAPGGAAGSRQPQMPGSGEAPDTPPLFPPLPTAGRGSPPWAPDSRAASPQLPPPPRPGSPSRPVPSRPRGCSPDGVPPLPGLRRGRGRAAILARIRSGSASAAAPAAGTWC